MTNRRVLRVVPRFSVRITCYRFFVFSTRACVVPVLARCRETRVGRPAFNAHVKHATMRAAGGHPSRSPAAAADNDDVTTVYRQWRAPSSVAHHREDRNDSRRKKKAITHSHGPECAFTGATVGSAAFRTVRRGDVSPISFSFCLVVCDRVRRPTIAFVAPGIDTNGVRPSVTRQPTDWRLQWPSNGMRSSCRGTSSSSSSLSSSRHRFPGVSAAHRRGPRTA